MAGGVGLSVNAVLGHYPAYVEAADALGAARFAVPGPVWAGWNAGARWSMNADFLQESMRRGRFLTTTPPSLARPGSAFLLEVAHLLRQGYPLVPTHRLDLL